MSLFLIGIGIAGFALQDNFPMYVEKKIKGANLEYTLRINIKEYEKYKELPRVKIDNEKYDPNLIPEYNQTFKNNYSNTIEPFTVVNETIEDILEEIIDEEDSNEDKAKKILDFVHSIEYKTDGRYSYTKYPIETVFEGSGDCEDLSVLFMSLSKAAKIDYIKTVFIPNSTNNTYHIAPAIAGDFTGAYIEYKNIKYYFAETTHRTYGIGVHPVGYESNEKILLK